MSKTKWEGKVGQLLKTDQFIWTHKCPDIFDRRHPYAGKSRVDWVALDFMGNGWMIEVKYLDRQAALMFDLFNKRDGVSPGQRGELRDFGQAGYALLAVGHKGTDSLYIFEWSWIEKTLDMLRRDGFDEQTFKLDLSHAGRIITYPRGKGPQEELRWSQSRYPFSEMRLAPGPSTFPTLAERKLFSVVLSAKAVSPSTSKQWEQTVRGLSIPTSQGQRSVSSLLKLEGNASS